MRYRLGGHRAWMVWSAAIAVYILAVFHRTSLGVAGLVAAERFQISSAQLATFTMVQLFVYAAMQPNLAPESKDLDQPDDPHDVLHRQAGQRPARSVWRGRPVTSDT